MVPRTRWTHCPAVDYRFEWDIAKAGANFRKHGFSFEEASTVFGDRFALLMADADHSYEEHRFLLLGLSRNHRLLVVAFAERAPQTRLISARRAAASERRAYEEG